MSQGVNHCWSRTTCCFRKWYCLSDRTTWGADLIQTWTSLCASSRRIWLSETTFETYASKIFATGGIASAKWIVREWEYIRCHIQKSDHRNEETGKVHRKDSTKIIRVEALLHIQLCSHVNEALVKWRRWRVMLKLHYFDFQIPRNRHIYIPFNFHFKQYENTPKWELYSSK